METLLKDLRLAFRVLGKNPGFTVLAVLTLALGIAVNATMFSGVSAFLLRRPPGHHPDRVAVVSSVNPNGTSFADVSPVSAPNYLAWRATNHVFAEVAAADEFRTSSLTIRDQPEALHSAAVSPNYFTVLEASPEIGRTFAEGEDQPGHDHVVILSHDLWVRRFASDPAILGRTVRLNRENWAIVGVMPANFRMLGFIPELWTPLVLDSADQTATAHQDRSLYLFGRLKPGVTLEQARAEMATLATRTQEDFPETEKGWGAAVHTLPDFLIYLFSVRSALAVLMTAVGFVLLIACANVAGLLLARAAGRRKELAIRISLGASRLRIVRQLLTEGLVIAFFGGSLGLVFAFWGIRYLQAGLAAGNEYIRAVTFELDWNVLLFAVAVSVLCAVLCGAFPALNAARTDVNANLKDENRAASGGRSQSRLRTVMVTSEIALALFLLVGTGLLMRAVFTEHHQDLGFQREHLLTAAVTLDEARYKDSAKQLLFVQEFIRYAEQIPGASGVAATSDLPATGAGRLTMSIKGQPELPVNQRPRAVDYVVTPEFFRVAAIPLLRGRGFTEMDNRAMPRVVVVNREFVHRHLHDQEPLGREIALDVVGAAPGKPQWSEIVGVVGNVKNFSGETHDDPAVYEPFSQRPLPSISLIVRSGTDPDGLAAELRKAVAQVDSELPLSHVMSMSAVLDVQNAGDQVFSQMLGTFAILALILSAIGIYGLVAYSVGQRTHEIGIRMALGARSPDVLRMILWQGMKMTVIGGTIGLLLALPLPKLFEAIFYGMHVQEPGIYLVVPLVVLLVAMLATYVPARRAAQVDPMRALRQE